MDDRQQAALISLLITIVLTHVIANVIVEVHAIKLMMMTFTNDIVKTNNGYSTLLMILKTKENHLGE